MCFDNHNSVFKLIFSLQRKQVDRGILVRAQWSSLIFSVECLHVCICVSPLFREETSLINYGQSTDIWVRIISFKVILRSQKECKIQRRWRTKGTQTSLNQPIQSSCEHNRAWRSRHMACQRPHQILWVYVILPD